MLDKVCQYSTVIFAGNVSVLIIVAVMTDYWEYRDYNTGLIMDTLHQKPESGHRDPADTDTKVWTPEDTESYIMVTHLWSSTIKSSARHNDAVSKYSKLNSFTNTSYYEPPALLHKQIWLAPPHTNTSHRLHLNRSVTSHRRTLRTKDKLVLFVQYGNLFRDCDDLEGIYYYYNCCYYFITTLMICLTISPSNVRMK